MKINWHFNISLQWFRIPLIPYISLTEIKPVVVVQTIPAPEAAILPMPAKPAQPTGKGTEHTKEREYDPDKRYRRGIGPMAGTEAYRAIHVKRDLIQWFTERNNKPLTLAQIRTMKKSPLNHAWQKCELTCTHRVASEATLRRVLRNARTEKEVREGIPQVITFVKKRRGFTLDKDFYKSVYGRDTLIDQWQPPTPQAQLPEETSSALTISSVAAYIKENSEIRR